MRCHSDLHLNDRQYTLLSFTKSILKIKMTKSISLSDLTRSHEHFVLAKLAFTIAEKNLATISPSLCEEEEQTRVVQTLRQLHAHMETSRRDVVLQVGRYFMQSSACERDAVIKGMMHGLQPSMDLQARLFLKVQFFLKQKVQFLLPEWKVGCQFDDTARAFVALQEDFEKIQETVKEHPELKPSHQMLSLLLLIRQEKLQEKIASLGAEIVVRLSPPGQEEEELTQKHREDVMFLLQHPYKADPI